MDLYRTGIRPIIDDLLVRKSKERRDYGDYWPASSAGYCMRKVIFDRLQVPHVGEDPRKQRVFESGHIFHEWMQRTTREAGISLHQELELTNDDIMVRGHIDDLVNLNGTIILYDYKTVHSRSFSYQQRLKSPMSYYHRMQLGTYLYMLRAVDLLSGTEIREGRILKISKDDLRTAEQSLLWDTQLSSDVVSYWKAIQDYWKSKTLPGCTCDAQEGGFMARERYNPYYYQGEPCSLKWLKKNKEIRYA